MSQVSNPSDRQSDRKTRIILGCGYVGMQVAKIWLGAGDRVLALTRSVERAAELEKLGIEPLVWDWLDQSVAETSRLDVQGPFVGPVSTILMAVSHASASHAQALAQLLKSPFANTDSSTPRWIYLSTTGVFADPMPDGPLWVDESSPVAPKRSGSVNALEAEQWLEHSGIEHIVLRPAGIYGPGRIPNLQPLRDGESMAVDPESYLNLIHVEDLALAIAAVAQGPIKHRLYCVSDGHSVQRKEYYAFIAQCLDLPKPIFSECFIKENMRKRSQGNKRVSNKRLLADYSLELRFPDYRSGLLSLVEEMSR
ncbi:MAG: NAD-dependent epimerase/dehydratase family protein [Pirellula sp.]